MCWGEVSPPPVAFLQNVVFWKLTRVFKKCNLISSWVFAKCLNHTILHVVAMSQFPQRVLSSSSDSELLTQAAMAIPVEIISKVIEQTAKVVDEQVEAQLSKLNEMDDDDLERLKERRLEALKKAQKQKQVSVRLYPPG